MNLLLEEMLYPYAYLLQVVEACTESVAAERGVGFEDVDLALVKLLDDAVYVRPTIRPLFLPEASGVSLIVALRNIVRDCALETFAGTDTMLVIDDTWS